MARIVVSPLRVTPSFSRLPLPLPLSTAQIRFSLASAPESTQNKLDDEDSTVLGSHHSGQLDIGDPRRLFQYLVLRRDLIDISLLGSVVTQGCHASVSAIWSHKDDPHSLQYCSPETIDSMHKVTLEVKGETQILNLAEKLKVGGIQHKLWIEQPENFPISLATKLYPKSMVSSYFKKLKLCK